jgi:two-component sensor histidine kinase
MYKGVASLYLFAPEVMVTLITYSSVIVAMPTIFLALFTQNILTLQQYPKLNRILNSLLILYPIIIVIIQITEKYQYRSIFFIITLVYLFIVTCYALFKKNIQARFIIVGWFIYISSGVSMYLSSLGTYDIFEKYPYLTELSLVIEIVVFSLALASKIKMLNQEKLTSQRRALLLKELNHRFKNNMQIILSFIFFQKNKIEDQKVNELLTNLENRIFATTELYSLLDTEDNRIVVDTKKYFSSIVDNIKDSFAQTNVEINILSDINMDSNYVVHCGIIVNEAVTNAFKYAFINQKEGNIKISLYEESNQYHLSIKDNGSGLRDKVQGDSLGMKIIDLLATMQLKGTLNIENTNGVEIKIIWSKNEK